MESDQQQQQSPPPPLLPFPEMGRMGSAGFSAEHYVFLNTLIESRSARDFYIQIANTDFSAQCVAAFFKILTSGFDKSAILARNTDQQLAMRKIDFEIALNIMVSECHESDVQNPAFLTFRENIKQTFMDFISRSRNAAEREQLLRQEYNIYPMENKPPQAQQTQSPSVGDRIRQFGRQP